MLVMHPNRQRKKMGINTYKHETAQTQPGCWWRAAFELMPAKSVAAVRRPSRLKNNISRTPSRRPSRLKSNISRTPSGCRSQRGIHLNNFDDSSILIRIIAVAENFEKCEDLWKVTFRAPICLLLSVLCSLFSVVEPSQSRKAGFAGKHQSPPSETFNDKQLIFLPTPLSQPSFAIRHPTIRKR